MSDRLTKGLLLLLGCAVLGLLVRQEQVVPTVQAQPKTVEYLVLTTDMLGTGSASASRALNDAAAKGWRARSATVFTFPGQAIPQLVVLLEKP